MDITKINEKAWDQRVEANDCWSVPVSIEEIERARKGEWDIVLTPFKKVPREWFPHSLKDMKILCLASGGGQQGPVLAAAGGEVTVFDNSLKQLEQDIWVAERDGLTIKTVQGDMKNLAVFEDESFDFIVHPWSNCFVDDVRPVWKEAARVLKKGGTLISGFSNGFEYLFDYSALCNGEFDVQFKLPYSDLDCLSEDALKTQIESGEGICFGHTLEDQIQGQIDAGFVIAGFYEDFNGSALDAHIPSAIATRAIKLTL